MTFDELIDIIPNVRVCDIIQLFLLSGDDKIYLNLMTSYEQYLLNVERIISGEWCKYYECKVICISVTYLYESAVLTLVIDDCRYN